MNLKERIDNYVTEGWLISQRHPELPLTIYNYSQETQFEKHWDEITLMCRGLVLDDDGFIWARPFKKFFNWEEIIHSTPAEVFNQEFEAYEKMDGSLGIGFFYYDEFVFASRGSFTSKQARKGEAIRLHKYDFRNLSKGLTYIFEIIYGNSELKTVEIHLENGKVVKYNPESFVNTKNGKKMAKDLSV